MVRFVLFRFSVYGLALGGSDSVEGGKMMGRRVSLLVHIVAGRIIDDAFSEVDSRALVTLRENEKKNVCSIGQMDYYI